MLERMKKQGLLVLTAHFGSFEMFHAAIAAHGANVSLVHRPMANPHVDDFLSAFRGRFGTRVLARGHAAREILRELRAGRIVAIPFDQAAQKENRIFLPFFGVNASTNLGARATRRRVGGAGLHRSVGERRETMFHRAVMGPEIPISADRRPRCGRDREHAPLQRRARGDHPRESGSLDLELPPLEATAGATLLPILALGAAGRGLPRCGGGGRERRPQSAAPQSAGQQSGAVAT